MKKRRKQQQKRTKQAVPPLKTDKILQKLKGIDTCCGNSYSTLSAQ